MINQPPKAIYFDWDGTLVDSFSFIQSAHNHVFNVLDLENRANDWFRPYFGQPREFIYADIYGGQSAEAQKHFEAFVVANHTQMLEPLAGAGELLCTAQNLGVDMGVVSNKRPDFIAAEMAAFGWEGYFSAIVGAAEALEDKPSSAPLLLAMERSGKSYDMSDIWYVGDTEVDMRCARNAGCTGIFYDYMGEDIAWNGENQPFMTILDCAELNKFLLELTKKAC